MNKTFDCSKTFGGYLRLTAKMMNNFKFKLVDEDQLMKIVKQVREEKRRIRDDDEKRTFLLEKEKRSCPTVNVDKVLAGENEIPTINSDRLECQDCNCDSMNSVNKCHQNDNNIIKDNNNRALPSAVVCKEQVRSICDQTGVQRCSTVSLNRPENKKMVVFIKNIQVLRERLLSYLDAFLQQHEQSAYENVSKNNSRCEERHQRKIKAYQYHILKLDYQLVLDMKNLNHCIMRHDVLGLLKVLSKCHSSALQMFQVFLRGLPEILEKEREKNKFRELLKCMVTLSNFCKFIRNNITEIKPSRDLLMDDLKKRCKSILYAMEKIQECSDCLHKQMKKRREWNIHNDLFKSVQDTENKKNSIQLLSTNKIQISRNSFRKLVKKVFGAEGHKSSSSKVNNAAECEDNNFSGVSKLPKERYKEGIRKSKDLINNEDKNSDMPSNIKLILESDVDAGFKCISVGTQYSSSLENNVESIDAESFSNNLFIAFEKKLDNYFQNIFQHLSNDQVQRIDAEKELPIEELLELKNSASGNTFNNADNTSLPEELFQSRYKNETESSLKQHEAFELDKRVTETGEVFMKPSKQNGTLSNENGKLRKSPSNTVNKQLTSSCGSPSPEKNQRILPNKRNMASFDNVPCEMIGSISDRLIEECLNSFSYEIDTLITQRVIDLELT